MNTNDNAFTQQGRITSLFGVLLPPKKKIKDVRYITIRFVVTGVIPSKKNRQRARSNFWAIKASLNKMKSFIHPSAVAKIVEERLKLYIQSAPEHQKWLESTKPIVTAQAAEWALKYRDYGLVFPLSNISVKVYHYWADNRKRDLSNKFETLADMLVACGIIEDDSWQVMNQISSEGNGYSGQINEHITTIDLTARFSLDQ